MLSCLSAANQIPVADLISHLDFLQHSPLDSRTNFELGLTYQLLADEVKLNATTVSDITVPFSEGDLRRKAEESYRLCLIENPINSEALSNLAKLLSETENALSDENLTAIIADLYERALDSVPHFQGYINAGLFVRRAGRHRDAATVFSRGLAHHPNSTILTYGRPLLI